MAKKAQLMSKGEFSGKFMAVKKMKLYCRKFKKGAKSTRCVLHRKAGTGKFPRAPPGAGRQATRKAKALGACPPGKMRDATTRRCRKAAAAPAPNMAAARATGAIVPYQGQKTTF